MNKKILLMALLGAASMPVMAEGQWKYSTGVDYSSGDYGGDPVDTNTTYVPFSASYSTGNWQFKGSLAWLEMEGCGSVVGGSESSVSLGGCQLDDQGQPIETSESGMGDTWLSATYSVEAFPAESGFLDLGVKVKLPTADEDKGLGSGEVDYTLQADYFKPMGKATPFLTLAYKMKGEPSGVELDDVLFVSVGSDYRLSPETNVGLSLDMQEAASATGNDQMELFGYFNRKLDKQWSLMFYGYAGLDDGSPDYGAGIQVSYKP